MKMQVSFLKTKIAAFTTALAIFSYVSPVPLCAQELPMNAAIKKAGDALRNHNVNLAINLLTQEAKRGNGVAEFTLGEIYDNIPVPIHDSDKSMFWFIKAWKRGGDVGKAAAKRIVDVGAASGHTRKEMEAMLAIGELSRLLPKGNYRQYSGNNSMNDFMQRKILQDAHDRVNGANQ
jgi:TPR repeat protein